MWLEEDSGRIIYLDKLAQAVAQHKIVSADEEALNEGAATVASRMKFRKCKRILFRVAAALIGVALVTNLFFLFLGERKENVVKVVAEIPVIQQTVGSPKGVVTRFTLADGTKVWLAPGSELTFPSAFRGSRRQVRLVGQAYFEVTHNKDKHFFVKTTYSEVEVLGTKFNVMAYPDAANVQTTLVEGKVNIRFGAEGLSQKGTILEPSQRITYSKGSDDFRVEEADLNLDLAWKESKLSFRNETFMEVAKKIELAKDVHFVVDEKLVPNKRFTGSFDHESLEEILSTLSKISPFEYTISQNKVVVKPMPMN